MRTSAVLLLTLAGAAAEAQTTFVVNSAMDAVDASPGVNGCQTAAGTCTLRAAIMEANALAGDDVIQFDPALNGVPIVLTIPAVDECPPFGCFNEGLDAAGDLDIIQSLTLTGNGPANTIIQGGVGLNNQILEVVRVSGFQPITATISGITVRNGSNPASGQGGITLNVGADLVFIHDTVVSDNNGNGIWVNFAGEIFLDRVTVAGNRGPTGGGLSARGSNTFITIANSTFSDNVADDGAGGGFGGAMAFSMGFRPGETQVTISNTTLSGNRAAEGCAIYDSNGVIELHDVTFADNCDPGSGAAVLTAAVEGEGIGSIVSRNSIVGSPAGVPNCRILSNSDYVGSFVSQGYNTTSDATCPFGAAGDISNTDPLLAALGNNGGPTQTHLPLPGSQVIDSGSPGDCPATDQRGNFRPTDGDGDGNAACDRGAVEAGPGSPPPVTGAIRGTAWDDTANFGVRDPGEPGYSGLPVCVFPTSPLLCRNTLADGTYEFTNLAPGAYHAYERLPADRMNTTPRSVAVAVTGGGSAIADFGSRVPPPPPPEWELPAIRQEVRKGPTFSVRVTAPCPATSVLATISYSIPPLVSLPMAYDAASNTWVVEFATPGGPGEMPLKIEADCSPRPYFGSIVFIDPSGMIVDGCTGEPLDGATVTLQKNEPFESDDYVVPDPAEHIPSVNPLVTAADGLYAWDVVPGRWRVSASKPGYETVITDPFDIPPPKLNLDIALHRTNGCNVPPVAANDAFGGFEDLPLFIAVPGVLENDSDANGGALRAVLASGPAYGSLALALDGSFLYTPGADFSGVDGFTYVAEDPEGAVSDVATVAIGVTPVNDPPFAAPDGYATNEGLALTVAAPGVLGNDGDPDGPGLIALLVTGPSNGSLALDAGGSFTYTPSPGFHGDDGFTYQASDGSLASAPVAVSVTVRAGSDEGWTPTGSLVAARTSHTATLLANGTVLVAGGYNSRGPLKSAELYDPEGGSFSPSGNLLAARSGHSATSLGNGKVLVAGGLGFSGVLRNAELYDPSTGTWSSTGPLTAARWGHTATRLADGSVLVAGGGSRLSEIYDPSKGKWKAAGNLNAARAGHTATLLSDGSVLVAGGVSGLKTIKSAEIFHPTTGKWSPAGNLVAARSLHTATEIPDGRILIAGGFDAFGAPLKHAEIYDRGTRTSVSAGSLGVARGLHTATLLPDGRVLAAGGFGHLLRDLEEAETYEPLTGKWTPVESLGAARGNHTATPLLDGTILVVGGGVLGLASAERFTSE